MATFEHAGTFGFLAAEGTHMDRLVPAAIEVQAVMRSHPIDAEYETCWVA